MRTALANHVDEVVQLSGTINTWEEVKGRPVTRLLISNPEIKKANKHVLFDQQDLISQPLLLYQSQVVNQDLHQTQHHIYNR